jgi:hypothetical protein
MASFKNIPVKFKSVILPITIKEPYKPDLQTFDTTDEFTAYFRANEDMFKEAPKSEEDNPKFLSANKLNRTYKIPGYRIRIINKGKDNEELTLVKDYYSRTSDDTNTNEKSLNDYSANELVERMNRMDETIQQLVDQINNIEEFLLHFKHR